MGRFLTGIWQALHDEGHVQWRLNKFGLGLAAAFLAGVVLLLLLGCGGAEGEVRVHKIGRAAPIHVNVDGRRIPCIIASGGISCDWGQP